MKRDRGLDRLLSLDGLSFRDDSGYWWKIEARRVTPTLARPHGIKYSLTLHDAHGKRVLGFDNAHAVSGSPGGKYAGEIVEYDHVHTAGQGKILPYTFHSADQLLADFFTAVNKVLES